MTTPTREDFMCGVPSDKKTATEIEYARIANFKGFNFQTRKILGVGMRHILTFNFDNSDFTSGIEIPDGASPKAVAIALCRVADRLSHRGWAPEREAKEDFLRQQGEFG